MFEKIKEKAAKGKQWITDNQSDIKIGIYGALMGVAGAVVTYAVYTHDDKK
jgi:hypothetical protein